MIVSVYLILFVSLQCLQLTAVDINLFDIVENHKLLAGEGFLGKFPLTKKNNQVVGAHFTSYIASGRR